MSFSSLRSTIESHFSNNWSHTPVEYDNVPLNLDNVKEYVSLVILETKSAQTSLGPDGEYTISGFVVVSIYTARGTGTNRSKQLADYVANIFRGVKIDSTLFFTPSGSKIHNRTAYFQFNITAPFSAYFNI